jgi:DEAD/DEAH box helicase
MAMPNLISPRFRDLHSALLVADFKRSRGIEDVGALSDADVSYLMMVASRLALHSSADSAEIAEECQLAYDVAVRATVFSSQRAPFDELSKLILSRLGNFPAKALLDRETADTKSDKSDLFLTTECAVREGENSREDLGSDLSLTDFQVRLLDMLSTKNSVSVSAPTSAGKSLALELELIRLLRSSDPLTAVFVVPTRALIRQVSLELIELVRTRQLSASVLASPTVPTPSKRPDAPRHTIFVLTQERLATLLAEAPPTFVINAVLVDEAHEIAKEKRGQILERVLVPH